MEWVLDTDSTEYPITLLHLGQHLGCYCVRGIHA